jgi:hypothetical protein
MTHYKSLIDTEYLGQWDLPPGRDVVVLIAKVERWTPEVPRSKKLPDGTRIDEPNKRVKLSFQGKKKTWLCGPVSQQTIAAMYGPHIEQWIGKPVALYVDPTVKMGRTTTGGLRVRPQVPHAKATEDPMDRPVDVEAQARIAQGRIEAG